MALIIVGLCLLATFVLFKFIQLHNQPIQASLVPPVPPVVLETAPTPVPITQATPAAPVVPAVSVAAEPVVPVVQNVAQNVQNAPPAVQNVAEPPNIHQVLHGITRIIQVRMDADDPEIQQILNGTTTTPETVVERQDGETFEQFANRNEAHNDDSENVHNHQVVKGLKSRYEQLVRLNGNLNYPPDDLQDVLTETEWKSTLKQQTFTQIANRVAEYLDGEPGSNEKLQKIEAVLDKIKKGSSIMSLSADPRDEENFVKEDWLLINAWWRIQNSDNAPNKDKLEISLIDQLIDCGKISITENPFIAALQNLGGDRVTVGEPRVTLVCVQGRASRVLQAFTLLDADSLLAAPVLDDAEIRNAAFSETFQILQRELDSKGGNIRDLYDEIDDDALSPADIVELERFKNHVREQVQIQLTAKFGDITNNIDQIIEDAAAGI